ncbi:hypothetical protein [Halorhabdus salina]|uniref:hypothetical protein n=1 Tax=Halorhabdus salina TaxID=2750670 RepID=UPI0015EFB1E2|nr:hypothetical protein [Halorhabdus salina]
MAVSDSPRSWIVTQGPIGPASRYDLYLATVPLVFFMAALLSVVVSVPTHVAMVFASVLTGAVLFDGLFLNPPQVDDSS